MIMEALLRVGIFSILFCATLNLTNGQACVTQEKIDNITAIVADLTTLLSGLPDPIDYTDASHIAQYTALLTSLCTTERSKLDTIEVVAAGCSEVLLQVPSLFTLTIAGQQFILVYSAFASIDEFCSCTPYLLSAWAVAGMDSLLKVTDNTAPFSPYSNLDTYCGSADLSTLINALEPGISVCPPLGVQAGLANNARITETKTFITDTCGTYDTTKYSCAVTQSLTADFSSCLASPPSNLITDTGDADATIRCERRVCASKYIAMNCDVTARDYYISAVNLQRGDVDVAISTTDCAGCTSTLLIAAWTVAALDSTLKTTDNNAALSPYANLDTYCSTASFISNVDTLAAGVSGCNHLGTEASLVSNTRITDTKTYTDSCSSFDATKYECAINTSLTSDFMACIANPPSTAPSTICGRRECVVTYIESACETSGRDYYLLAVNVRASDDLIALMTTDCSGAVTMATTALATLVILLIHYII